MVEYKDLRQHLIEFAAANNIKMSRVDDYLQSLPTKPRIEEHGPHWPNHPGVIGAVPACGAGPFRALLVTDRAYVKCAACLALLTTGNTPTT